MKARVTGPAYRVPLPLSWGITERLPLPIQNAGQAQLADGRCLLFGGQDPTISPQAPADIANCYLFAADGKSFVSVGSLPAPASGMVGTTLGDGRVLAIPQNGIATNALTFDPNTLLWTTQAAMAQPYYYSNLVTLANGNALLIAGAIPFTGLGTTDIAEYDQTSNLWIPRASCLNPRYGGNSTLLPNGEVFVSGRYPSNTGVPEVYVPGTNSWHLTVNLPSANNFCQTQVVLPTGKLFTCTSGPNFVLIADMYDPATRRFIPLPTWPSAQSQTAYMPQVNGFYIGDGLIVVCDLLGSPRTAIFDYRKNRWYGGSFDAVDTLPRSGGNLFHLGQTEFLSVGGGNGGAPFPHLGGRYAEISTQVLNDGRTPTFDGILSVTQGTAPDRALVRWAAASDTKTHPEDINYYVAYSLTPGGQDWTTGIAADTEIWAGQLSREITGLSPGSTYYFRVRAKNLLTSLLVGNFDNNTAEISFTPNFAIQTPAFNWKPTVPLHSPRMGLYALPLQDGRNLVFGGFLSGGAQALEEDTYSQTGTSAVWAPASAYIVDSAVLAGSPIMSTQGWNQTGYWRGFDSLPQNHYRPTSIGGRGGAGEGGSGGGARYPYGSGFGYPTGADYNSYIKPLLVPVLQNTAVQMPGGDILCIGGWMNAGPGSGDILDYNTRVGGAQFPAFDTITGSTSGATATVLEDGAAGTEGSITLQGASGPFTAGEVLTASPSGITAIVTATQFTGIDSVRSVQRMTFCETRLEYYSLTSAFTPGLVVTGVTSGVQALILADFPSAPTPYLVVRLFSDDPNFNFQVGESIVDSGTGSAFANNQALLFASYSSPPAQSWSFVAPMSVPRYQHSSVVLADGKVLVVGGIDRFGNPVYEVEIYSPFADTWTFVPTITLDLTSEPVPFVPGEVITGQTSLTQATVIGHIGTALTLVKVTPGFVFSAGEEILGSLGGDGFVTTTQDYLIGPHSQFPMVKLATGTADVSLDYLNQTAPFAVADTLTGTLSGATATILATDTSVAGSGALIITALSGSFRGGETLTASPSGGSATANGKEHGNAKVLCIGGDSDALDIFDPATNSFTPGALLDAVKSQHTAHLFGNDQVGIFGGLVGGAAVADVRVYDPASNTWTVAPSMLTARTRHASLLLPNNTILVAGGEDGLGNPTATAELSGPTTYQTVLNAIVHIPPLSAALNSVVASSLLTTLNGYWTLDGNSVDVINANNGTDTAITYSVGNGKINQGAGFNGSTSKIVLTETAALKPTNLTVAAWVNTTDAGSYREVFASLFQSGSVAGFELRKNISNKLELVIGNNTNLTQGSGYQFCASSASINTGAWIHVAGTYDGATMKTYINGVLDGSIAYAGGLAYSAGNTRCRIGVNNYVGGTEVSFWIGAIDEPCVWGRALSPSEIAYLANAPTGRQYPF